MLLWSLLTVFMLLLEVQIMGNAFSKVVFTWKHNLFLQHIP